MAPNESPARVAGAAEPLKSSSLAVDDASKTILIAIKIQDAEALS